MWDWLQLLVVPVALASLAFLLNDAQSRRDHRLEDERAARQRAIAADSERENTLRAYLEEMSDLIRNGKLLRSPQADAPKLARIATLTTVRRLDSTRRGIVVRFLAEAKLLRRRKNGARVHVASADLRHANLRGADLTFVDLRGADLRHVDLRGAQLFGADLRRANLSGANLQGAEMTYAVLGGALLREADLRRADLSDANLGPARVTASDSLSLDNGRTSTGMNTRSLRHVATDLRGADLRGAELSGANFRDAKVSGADVRGTHEGVLDEAVGLPRRR
jgi:hypothetical protein